jgi:hypothetical protein
MLPFDNQKCKGAGAVDWHMVEVARFSFSFPSFSFSLSISTLHLYVTSFYLPIPFPIFSLFFAILYPLMYTVPIFCIPLIPLYLDPITLLFVSSIPQI